MAKLRQHGGGGRSVLPQRLSRAISCMLIFCLLLPTIESRHDKLFARRRRMAEETTHARTEGATTKSTSANSSPPASEPAKLLNGHKTGLALNATAIVGKNSPTQPGGSDEEDAETDVEALKAVGENIKHPLTKPSLDEPNGPETTKEIETTRTGATKPGDSAAPASKSDSSSSSSP